MKKVTRVPKTKSTPAPKSLTADEYLRRHEYCINMADLQRAIRDSKGYIPKNGLKAVCDHEEDGFCGHSITPEKLKEVNDHLAGTTTEDRVAHAVKSIHAIEEDIPHPEGKAIDARRFETFQAKRGRGRPRLNKVAEYHCLQCRAIHTEKDLLYLEHNAFRRKRGRPPKAR